MVIESTIFCKQTDDIKTIFQTFAKYPIDTFCASQNDYQMLDQQEQRKNNTYVLQHLFSTEPIIDDMIQFRWYSSANLHIQDNWAAISADLNSNSEVQTV